MENESNKSVTTTSAECLAKYSPKEVSAAFRNVGTAVQALSVAVSGSIASLGQLCRNLGGVKVSALLKLYLIELNEILGLKTPMSEAQIDAVSEEILSKYPYMNMADINLVFRRIKCGECGKLYDRLTMPQIMQIFSDYNDERCAEAARMAREEADSFKSDYRRSSEKAKDLQHRARLMDFTRRFKKVDK